MNPLNPYLQIIKSRSMQTLSSHLDPIEQRMIERLAITWSTSEKPTVLQTMRMDAERVSPSTVHRRLKALRSKGFIKLVKDTADSRTKYVMPTKSLMDLFDQLGKAARLAVNLEVAAA